jgi:hypothetical protein
MDGVVRRGRGAADQRQLSQRKTADLDFRHAEFGEIGRDEASLGEALRRGSPAGSVPLAPPQSVAKQ